MPLSSYNGEWEQTDKGDNFKEFLAAMGIGLIKRNVANKMSRTIIFKATGDNSFDVVSKSSMKTNDVSIVLGNKQSGQRDDGMDVTTCFTLNGENIVQDEEAKDGKKYQYVWEVAGDVLKITLKIDEIVCVQVYKKK